MGEHPLLRDGRQTHLKKPLTIVVLLLVAAAILVGVAVATINIDRLRPLIGERLSQAVGRPVTLERLAWRWQAGVAVQAQGITVHEVSGQDLEPLIRIESAYAVVRLWPLLQRRIEVASVGLEHPQLRVIRDVQGQWNLTGLAVAGAPAAAAQPSGPPKPGGVTFKVGSLRIQDGVVRVIDQGARPPVTLELRAVEVALRNIAPGQPMDIDAGAALGGSSPNLRLRGELTLPGPQTPGAIEQARLTIERLPLEAVVPAGGAGEPALHGVLSGELDGRLPTLEPAQAGRSASGSGRLRLAEPVIANLNVLRTVFEKLSIIPGLVQMLEARLPADYQEKLAARDTVLAPIEIALRLRDGWLEFDDAALRTDTFQLSGPGRVGVDGTLQMQTTLRIEPQLSAAIVRSVQELDALANAQGELELPVAIQGRLPRVAVLPDVQGIASRLAVRTAVGLLERALSPSGDAAESEGEPQEDPLGGLLRGLLNGDTAN